MKFGSEQNRTNQPAPRLGVEPTVSPSFGAPQAHPRADESEGENRAPAPANTSAAKPRPATALWPTLLALFVLGLGLLIVRELRTANPIIDCRVLRERNFAVRSIIIFLAFAVVYCVSIALPTMLQGLYGYDALRSGLAMSRSGVSSMAGMIVAGFLLGRQFDARCLIAAGVVVMAAGNYWMARMSLHINPLQVIGPRMVLTLGLGLLFAPISVAAYKYILVHRREAEVGLLSLLRTEGGSVGTSLSHTIQEPR